jgi:hypothetical protein
MRVDARDARAAGPLSQPGDQRVDGGGLADDLDLDPPVGKIADPSAEAEAPRLVGGGGAKSDTLNAAAHDGVNAFQG